MHLGKFKKRSIHKLNNHPVPKITHIDFPQKPPIIKVINVNKTPILALVLENNRKKRCFVRKNNTLLIAIAI
jgi:hypothetical protein